jgi:hypothetical protein
LIGAAVILLKLDFFAPRRIEHQADEWPVFARRVLSAAEQKCFHRLRAACPEHVVLAQVSMIQILGVKRHTSRQVSVGIEPVLAAQGGRHSAAQDQQREQLGEHELRKL